ncbi:MAG: ABC transporter permease [Proteobacteria bacterium]|nr:ABC transporter permease [Pseudomonadota bacterium]
MKTVSKMVVINTKLFVREFEGFFFTMIFPIIMLLIFGSIYGNKASDYFGGFGFVDVSVPAYIGIIIAITGLMSIPISIASDRERGILRRYRTLPGGATKVMISWVLFYYLVTTVGTAGLIVTGKLLYGLRFTGNALLVFFLYSLSTIAFLSIGFLLASFMRSARSANAIGMSLLFPMMFFSGAIIPMQNLPLSIKQISVYLPLTYVVDIMQKGWFGGSMSQYGTDLLVLSGIIVVSFLIVRFKFRW